MRRGPVLRFIRNCWPREIRSGDSVARERLPDPAAFLPWHGACATIRRAKKRRVCVLWPIAGDIQESGLRHGLRMNPRAVENAADFMFVARRNNSLSSGGRFLVLGSLAVVVLAISLGFALNGAWLVFPFAGLDIVVVFLAFRYVGQRAGDFECISLQGDTIIIERHSRGSTERFEFNRYWVQVEFNQERGGGQGRLLLRSHGKEAEFGIHLTAGQRAVVARRLTE